MNRHTGILLSPPRFSRRLPQPPRSRRAERGAGGDRYAHRDGEVRKHAIFWLGQSKDPRALEFIERILTK